MVYYGGVTAVHPPSGDTTGVTDQSYIQAALNAAAPGGTVVFPPGAGQYLVTGNLQIPDYVTIDDSAWNPHAAVPRIKLVNSSGSGCVLAAKGYLTAATSSGNPIVIRGLSIDVNGANNASSHGIVIMNYSSVVEHCYVLNPGLAGIVQSDANSAGTPIGNTAVENVIARNKITWSAPAVTSGQYGIWVKDLAAGANTDGYLYDNIVQQAGDYAIRVERSAGWFIAHNHVYQCQGSGIWLDQFWDTFFHDNEVDIFGQGAGAATYYGIHVENIITGREGSYHDNQVGSDEHALSTFVYHYIRCPAITAGIDLHDNFAHTDSGAAASSTAYALVCSTNGILSVSGAGNKASGPATLYTVTGGGTVTFADAAPGYALGALSGNALAAGDETIPLLSVTDSNIQFTSGDMPLTYFTAQRNETVTKVIMNTGSVAGAGITLARFGLFTIAGDGSLTLVANTANDATLFGSTFTKYTKSLAANYALVAGTRYALGVLVVAGGTMPGLYGNWKLDSVTALNNVPRLAGNVTGLAALPSSVASGSVVATRSAPLYAQVTP